MQQTTVTSKDDNMTHSVDELFDLIPGQSPCGMISFDYRTIGIRLVISPTACVLLW